MDNGRFVRKGDPSPPRMLRVGTGSLLGALALALGVWAVVVALPDREGLRLPPEGGVSADYVEQHPVFVVRDADDVVRVLDATSPHDPFSKVLAWCETSQLFEDMWHGSSFNRHGEWIGGPSPSGMAEYKQLEQHDDRVVVGERQAAPDRLGPDEREGASRQGPWCADRTALYRPGHPSDPNVLDDLVVHDPVPEGVDADLWFPSHERILGQTDTRPSSSAEEEVVALPSRPAGGDSLDAVTGGVLAGNRREGCVWLEDAEQKITLVWHDGYRLDTSRMSVIDPDGEAVATVGDRVELAGGEAPHLEPDRCNASGSIWAVASIEVR